MIRITDLISIRGAPRPVSLAQLQMLREALDREGQSLTLATAAEISEFLGQLLASEGEFGGALEAVMSGVIADPGRGIGMLVRGPSGSGKTHLLCAAGLLLEYPQVWAPFLAKNRDFAIVADRVNAARPIVVVPVPLAEHRGHDEHLEDIVFDRTEAELRRAKYSVTVPLSEQSYALELIDRHVVPRYREGLDTAAAATVPGHGTWASLRRADPASAVRVARQLAQELNYPLDFRQSRVERLARLLEILRQKGINAVVWLLDDLSQFLSSAGPKAAHSDCSFLEFIGQRSKISPLTAVAALDEALEEIAGVEPYVLSGIRSGYDSRHTLSSANVRQVVQDKLIVRRDRQRLGESLESAQAAYLKAFGAANFTASELAQSYPLHPIALRCLESIASRFLGQADAFARFATAMSAEYPEVDIAEREARQLLGPAEVLRYFAPRVSAHPEASAYVSDVLDYYQKNIATVVPDDDRLGLQIVQVLIALRLANVSAPADLVAELVGLEVDGTAKLTVQQATDILETLRLHGSFVEVRRTPDGVPDVYYVDVRTNLSDILRQRTGAIKSTLADDDSRLWQCLCGACTDEQFPLAGIVEPITQEVEWLNTPRFIGVDVVNLAGLTSGDVANHVAELGDVGTLEDCRLFIAETLRFESQLDAWRELAKAMPQSRWMAGVLAWAPRDPTPQELDAVKECAACHQLLREVSGDLDSNTEFRERLNEERLTLGNEVRRIAHNLYYEGQVLSVFGPTLAGDALAALRGDWVGTLSAAVAPSLRRIFPQYPPIAPHRAITSRTQIDALVDSVIRPGEAICPRESALRSLAESFLGPLGLVRFRDDDCILDVSASAAARDILLRIRQRDQTPEHEMGRPLSCADLAQHLIKSPLGLPAELFELVVASLLRAGYMVALDANQEPLPFASVPTPVAANVEFVARPALLPLSQWQGLARLCRILLDIACPGPDHAAQAYLWEQLLAAREDYLRRTAELRSRLAETAAALGQTLAAWRETLVDLDAADEFFALFEPGLIPSIGLAKVIDRLDPYLKQATAQTHLTSLLRRIGALEGFLEGPAVEVIATRRYLNDPRMNLDPGGDLDVRRRRALDQIAAGEAVLSDLQSLQRQMKAFMAAYRRQYITGHSRAHRSSLFEQYQNLRGTTEYRALAQLQSLSFAVQHDAATVSEMIDERSSRRCANQDVAGDLDHAPVCSECGLRLGEELDLPPVSEVREAIEDGLAGYRSALSSSAFREALAPYVQGLPRRGDLSTKLESILRLGGEVNPRQITALFSEDVIGHLNRCMSGKTLRPRNMADLRDALAGRTVTKEEAQRLFAQWLDGAGEDEGESLLHIEP
jgi:hypothetical protein